MTDKDTCMWCERPNFEGDFYCEHHRELSKLVCKKLSMQELVKIEEAGISYGRAHPDREMFWKFLTFLVHEATPMDIEELYHEWPNYIDQFLASRTAQEKGG